MPYSAKWLCCGDRRSLLRLAIVALLRSAHVGGYCYSLRVSKAASSPWPSHRVLDPPARLHHQPNTFIGTCSHVRDSSLRGTRTSTTAPHDVPDEARATTYSTETVVTFSPYSRLMQLAPGQFEVSDPIGVPWFENCGGGGGGNSSSNSSAVETTLRFCVKLYPRGGGHDSQYTVLGKRTRSGFGMGYKVLPFFAGAPEKVGAYLQYLPPGQNDPSVLAVDASIGLRMVGRQRDGPRFDVEFRSGMRFVPCKADANLKEGRANDFGAHLMQTDLLGHFIGRGNDVGEADEGPPVQIRVSILVHKVFRGATEEESASYLPASGLPTRTNGNVFKYQDLVPRDIRLKDRSKADTHDAEQVRVGRIVVPVLTKLEQRPRMFQLGAYPGVEYRIMRVIDPTTDRDIFYSRPGCDYEIKPTYPLVQQLERPWPVRVNERDLPKLYTPAMYNTISAAASLVTAITGLVTAFLISQAVSIFFIPSHSMDPTLEVGDVLLVDKVTPRLFRQGAAKVGNVVLFHPPQPLQDFVAQSGGRKLGDRDLFVKRVAAVPGDVVTVERDGEVLVNHVSTGRNRNRCDGPGVASYLQAGDLQIRPGEVAVLGDCSKVSIDSRVWGALPTEEIVGRPIMRLWPLSRFGSIPALPVEN